MTKLLTRYKSQFMTVTGFRSAYVLQALMITFACITIDSQANNTSRVLGFNSGWGKWIDPATAAAGGCVVFKDNSAFITNPAMKKNHSTIQMIRNINITSGRNYKLQFGLESANAGIVAVTLGLRNKPYTSYCYRQIKITPENKYYECRLTLQEKIDAPLVLRLRVGTLNKAKISQVVLQEELPLALNRKWGLFRNVLAPPSFTAIPEVLLSPSGEKVTSQAVIFEHDVIDLARQNGGIVMENDLAILHNTFSCDRPGLMKAGVSADWRMEIYVNGQRVFSTLTNGNESHRYTVDDHIFEFPVRQGSNLLVAKVFSGSAGWKFVCGKTDRTPIIAMPNITFQKDSDWKAVDMSKVAIQAGTALDISSISRLASVERLQIGSNGKLALAGDLTRPVRLNGFNVAWNNPSSSLGRLSDRDICNLLKLIRRQGYNMIRFLNFDRMSPNKDMTIMPKILDRLDYFAFQARKHGVYLQMSIAAYGFFKREFWKYSINDLRARMFLGDSEVRALWKYGAEFLMNHVNPYTNVAWKDDPVVVNFEFLNEQCGGVMALKNVSRETRRLFDQAFQDWLKKKYQVPEALAQAWNDKTIISFVQVKAPENFREKGSFSNDFVLFCNDLLTDNAEWCEKTLRATGYCGLISQYNLPYGMGALKARYETSQIAIINRYHEHPSNFTLPGSVCKQGSAIEDIAGYWCSANSSRFADRPFFVTEHNLPFWNRYQYEHGILFGAYSALQGFDALTAFGDAVLEDSRNALQHHNYAGRNAMESFSIGNNPVARANEFLIACLYLRGDVKSSPHRIALEIPKAFLETNRNSFNWMAFEQIRIGLICSFSITFPDSKKYSGCQVLSPEMSLMVAGGNGLIYHEWFTEIEKSNAQVFSLGNWLADMKKRGVISHLNESNPEKGIYQSDTGEITMRVKDKILKVITPKSEAVALGGKKSETLNRLAVIDTSTRALIAVCSVDGKPIHDSDRMVLIYSTEVANDGMVVSKNRQKLIELGKFPVLMKTGRVNIKLKLSAPETVSLYALSMDGSRKEKLPLAKKIDEIELNIDTSALKNGPTPFFEIVKE